MLEQFTTNSKAKTVKEVQVQFSDEDPAWIPYDTLISMMETEIDQWM